MDSTNLSADAVETNRQIFKKENGLMGSDLFACFKNDIVCDAVLLADDGKRIPVHRVVLYVASDYFKALFTTELKERGQQEMSIKKVDGKILQQLVEYSYIGEVAIDSTNIEELTKAATMLQFSEVQANCSEFYTNMLRSSNCLGIREVADLHNMVELRDAAHDFALDHFAEVSQSEEFYQLTADHLSILLRDEEINVTSEEEIFSALMRWVKYDVNNRKQSLQSLLECVRFKHIKDSFFKEIAQQSIDLLSPELISTILALKSSDDLSQDKIPRVSTTSSSFNVAYQSFEMSLEIDRYISHRNIWTKGKTIDLEVNQNFAMVVRDSELIAIGGRDAQSRVLNTVKSINLKTYQVIDLPPITSSRMSASAELLESYSIYVFGGVGSNSAGVFSVERFEFQQNKWTLVKPMHTPRSANAHVVVSGILFAIGGVDEQKRRLNSVEYYVPLTNSWHLVASMRHARYGAAACALNGYIFVVGGRNDTGVLQSIERFNTREEAWIEMEFVLPAQSFWISIVLCQGDWAYIAGGLDSENRHQNSFYKINLTTGEMKALNDLRKKSIAAILFIPTFTV